MNRIRLPRGQKRNIVTLALSLLLAALTVVTAVILTLVTLLYLRATKKNSEIYGR